MTPEQKSWLLQMASQAYGGGHIYPRMAGCEAAVESAWGTSQLYRLAKNIFGTKQHAHPVCGTLSLPTKEYLDGDWKVVNADFVEYPSFLAAFKDRMDTLLRLRTAYPDYNAALMASTAEDYVTAVSRRWSTSPTRAKTCIEIYHEVWPPVSNAEAVHDATIGDVG